MSEMTQVAESSSVGGSSVANKGPAVFDVSNEAGMLALLRTIHRSGTKQKVKNELRDLLFAVKNDDTKSQAEVIKALEEAGFRATFGGKALHMQGNTSESEGKQSSFGRFRNVPSFGRSTFSVATPVHSEPAAEPVIQESVATTVEVPAEPKPETKTVETQTAPPPAADGEQSVESTPETKTEAVTPAPVAVTPGEDPMIRIKEIKRLVNEKVGNPITLIDTDNQVGREYMNALLSAMKVANGGRPDEVAAAMQRLEKAYEAAIKIAETAPPPETTTDKFVKATEQPKPTPTQPETTLAAEVASETASTPTAPTSANSQVSQPSDPTPATDQVNPVKINVKTSEVPVAPPAVQAAAPTPKTVNISAEPVTDTVDTVPVVNKTARPASAALASEYVPGPESASFTPVSSQQSSSASETEDRSPLSSAAMAVAPEAQQPVTAPAPQPDKTRMMSVAKEEQLQNLMRQNQMQEAQAKKAQSEQAQATTDPLHIPEITAGLKQLLSEWSLFKSSGFFGTGPGGMDHPLYRQMSGLTMAAVIAGRFEGATPQVKQSITDYMNGWRYEEGIVHEHTETFEHYLRRVIQHILDKKKKTGV